MFEIQPIIIGRYGVCIWSESCRNHTKKIGEANSLFKKMFAIYIGRIFITQNFGSMDPPSVKNVKRNCKMIFGVHLAGVLILGNFHIFRQIHHKNHFATFYDIFLLVICIF